MICWTQYQPQDPGKILHASLSHLIFPKCSPYSPEPEVDPVSLNLPVSFFFFLGIEGNDNEDESLSINQNRITLVGRMYLTFCCLIGIRKKMFFNYIRLHFWLFFGFHVSFIMNIVLGNPWTQQEERSMFLLCLHMLGEGDWRGRYLQELCDNDSICSQGLHQAIQDAIYSLWYGSLWGKFSLIQLPEYLWIWPLTQCSLWVYSYKIYSFVCFGYYSYALISISFAGNRGYDGVSWTASR